MDFGVFPYSWGCNFVDGLVFSFSKKTQFVFIEDMNLWAIATPTHEYHEN